MRAGSNLGVRVGRAGGLSADWAHRGPDGLRSEGTQLLGGQKVRDSRDLWRANAGGVVHPAPSGPSANRIARADAAASIVAGQAVRLPSV